MSAESRAALRDGLDLARWNVTDLWIASLGIGGAFARADVQRIADGRHDATAMEHDILAAALNDHLTEQGSDHPVRYWTGL